MSGALRLGDQDYRNLARGASVSFVGRMANSGLAAGTQILLARFLGRQEFGLFAIGWTVIKLGSLLGAVGLHHGVIRFGARHWPGAMPDIRQVVRVSMIWTLSLSLFLGAALFLAADPIAVLIFDDPALSGVMRIVAFALPFAAALKVGAAGTRISQKTKYTAISEDILRPTLSFAAVLGLLIIGLRASNALLAVGVSYAVSFLLVAYYLRRLFWRGDAGDPSAPSGEFQRALIAFSLPTFLAGFSTTLINRSDRLFLAYFLEPADVGVFQAASQGAVIFTMILSAFNAIFSPMIAELHGKGEHRRLNELYKVTTKWGFYLAIPVYLVFVVLAGEIMTFVFGPGYAGGAAVFAILSTAQLLSVATGAVGFMLLMTGNQKRWLAISGAMVVTHVVANLLLIPSFGIEGAALATAIGVGGLFLIGLTAVRRSLRLWPYDRRYWKGVLAALVALLALLGLEPYLASARWLMIAEASLLCAAVFFASLVLLKLEQEDRAILKIVWRGTQAMLAGRPEGDRAA